MIQLTRLNNHPLVVNSDLIKFVEQSPDTVITLVNGDKIVVRESAQDVLDRVVQFRRSVLHGITTGSDTGSALPPVINTNADSNAKGHAEGKSNAEGKGRANHQFAGQEKD
jgi:flagellar protein FlbD